MFPEIYDLSRPKYRSRYPLYGQTLVSIIYILHFALLPTFLESSRLMNTYFSKSIVIPKLRDVLTSFRTKAACLIPSLMNCTPYALFFLSMSILVTCAPIAMWRFFLRLTGRRKAFVVLHLLPRRMVPWNVYYLKFSTFVNVQWTWFLLPVLASALLDYVHDDFMGSWFSCSFLFAPIDEIGCSRTPIVKTRRKSEILSNGNVIKPWMNWRIIHVHCFKVIFMLSKRLYYKCSYLYYR